MLLTASPALSTQPPLNLGVCPPLLGAAMAGVDVDELLAAVGLDRAMVEDLDATVAAPARGALWREAIERTRDPALALHTAEQLPFGTFDVVDYVAAQAPTVGEGMAALSRYFRIIGGDFVMTFERDDRGGRLALELPAGWGARGTYSLEFILTCVVTRFRATVETRWDPVEMQLQHSRPAHVAEYERIFACPLHFERPANLLVFDRATLDLPQPRADTRLRIVLERVAAEALARLPEVQGFTAQVRQVLGQMLGEEASRDPTLERVARKLAISTRTLERRLHAEGTSFQAQLSALRCELARSYLANRRIAISEVAYLLGFSEPSAFHRAFKRWTGHTPQAWRSRTV